jgi:hypothetical protein
MTRLVLTDDLIREALGPAPHIVAPAGLMAQIAADVARTPQRRALRLPQLPRSRRVTWVLVAAATVLALLGVLVVSGGSRNPLLALLPPAPSPLPQELPVTMTPMAVEIEAVSADEAWASVGNGSLWHRTAAGWHGPLDPELAPRVDQVRDLARMPDGRIVVSADLGIWVGDEQGWEKVSSRGGGGVAVDANGVIWAGSMGGERGLRAYRATGGTWQDEAFPCEAGGFLVAASADRSIWTAGIAYSGSAGVARLLDGACGEIRPWGDGATHDVLGIAADREGRVTLAIMDLQEGDQFAGGRIVSSDGARWTTLSESVDIRRSGWNGLAYGPDGTLWAAFDGRLWRYADGVEALVRDNIGIGPVSVAPDGTVWFIAEDPATGATFVDRLLPDDIPAPATSRQAELKARSGAMTRLLAVDGDAAWVARSGDYMHDWLWHRDAAGWSGPVSIEDTAINPRMTAVVRGMAALADGRVAIATDTGLWVGVEGAWTRAWAGEAWDVAEADDGRLWVSGLPEQGDSALRVLRETGSGWQQDWSGCRAGGNDVALAADGSVWTTGITYSSGRGGVARVQDGTCETMHPLGDGADDEVAGITASPTGAVAVHVLDIGADGTATGGRVLEWQDGRWIELRAGSDLVGMWHALAYAPNGDLWATFDGALSRYADGQWQDVADVMPQAPISAAADGTVWYVRADGVIDRLRQTDVPGE